MSFIYLKHLPVVMVMVIIFILVIFLYERKYFAWIEKYWFFKRSWKSKLSTICLFLSFAFLSVAMMDFRGAETKVNTSIPDQRTIIIIDVSASMAVEDVQPNRLQKAIWMARNFVRNAVGHQISLVLFSDTHKRIVSFTDDIDLLDARLSGIGDIVIKRGGSTVSKAIVESLAYFKTGLTDSIHGGNLLVFSDFEETENFRPSLPPGISLMLVGVGTSKGAVIPMRSRDGYFRGFKKYKGKKVISSLDENSMKKLSAMVDHGKYLIPLTNNMPTEEIIDFFRNGFKKKMTKNDLRVMPVLVEWLVIPGILLLVCSLLLRIGKTFVVPTIIMLVAGQQLMVFSAQANAEGHINDIRVNKLDKKLKSGNISKMEELKLAEYLLRRKEYERAATLYEENIGVKLAEGKNILFNFGLSLLQAKKIKRGTNVLKTLSKRLRESGDDDSIKMCEDIRALVINTLNQEKRKQNEKKEQKSKDKNKPGQNKQQNNTGKGSKKKQQQKEPEMKKDENKKNEKGDNQNNGANKNMSIEEKEKKQRQQRKMVKIPALLKQILSDDRNLQGKFLDTSTAKKSKIGRKDW
ncbi:MAG: VWA domain-containing protein [Bacteriovoracaceae bacterium]|nr:VWA domain-containing protein [Bacteriovoracaceae bacterium]